MKKILALLLALSMVFALCACGASEEKATDTTTSETASASTEDKNEEETPTEEAVEWPSGRTIGMNLFNAGTSTFEIFATLTRVYTDEIGDTLQTFNDQLDINAVQSDVENIINFGCDGAMWWGVMDPFYQVGCPTFNDAGVYFSFMDCAPSDETLREEIKDLEYFAGSCSSDNYLLGQQMGEAAVAAGCKYAIVYANEIGSSVVDRAYGFQEVFEAAGGTVIEISHVSSTGNEHIEATRNYLATYPEIDCIYGVSIDYCTGASTVTATMPDRDVKLFGTDVTEESLKYLLDGTIDGINGGHWCSSYITAAFLINAMDGHKILAEDGKAPYLFAPSVVVTADNADAYKKYFIDDIPFHYEDVANLLYRNNPDVTIADFEAFLENYSVEYVVAQREG